jgi:histidinol phosphatase-like PHP family hydrolase
MGFFDFHIHTRFSSCCKFNYGYPDVWKKIQDQGLDGFGVADHSNFPTFDASFILQHREDQKKLNLVNRGLVGLEISIYDKSGLLGVNPKFLSQLDYFILAEHVHIAKIFSGFFTFKAHFMKMLQNYPKTESKINKELDKLLDMELKGINRYPHSILAHIFRFPVNSKFVNSKILDLTDRLLDALQTNDSVLELHSNFLFGIQKEGNQMNKKWGCEYSLHDFYENLSKRIKNYSIKFSLGSDAHNLANIHSKSTWSTFLQTITLPESALITPDFFLNGKN